MTPERAAYHRLMLLSGLPEEYEQELDMALETEDPISPLVLDLAFCMSDTQLEQAYEVLDVLVDVGKILRYALCHRSVAVFHVIYKDVKITVFVGKQVEDCHSEHFVTVFGYKILKIVVAQELSVGEHLRLEVQKGKQFQKGFNELFSAVFCCPFQICAVLGCYGNKLYCVAREYNIFFFSHLGCFFLMFCVICREVTKK